jgi:hypothetical protein
MQAFLHKEFVRRKSDKLLAGLVAGGYRAWGKALCTGSYRDAFDLRPAPQKECAMRAYLGISGTVFGTVAVLHLLRLVLEWPAQLGDWIVPFWISWPALLLTGGLCIWAIALIRGARTTA